MHTFMHSLNLKSNLICRDSQMPEVKEEFLSGATVLYGDVTNKDSIQVNSTAIIIEHHYSIHVTFANSFPSCHVNHLGPLEQSYS